MLFRSTEEIKKALGTVHQTLEFETLESFVPQAEIRYLLPYVGQELLDELDAALDDTPTPGQLALLGHLRRALVYYVVLDAAPFLNLSFSDLGIQEQRSTDSAPARQWVYHKFEDAAASNADVLLDNALFWLEAQAAKFPTWQDSEAYTASKELLLHSSYDMSKHVNIGQSRRTFLAMRSYMRRVEELEIADLVGRPRFEALKAAIVAGTLTEADKTLWAAIKPALAHRTMVEALPELAVQVTSAGVRVLADNDGIRERKAATLPQLDKLVYNHTRYAKEYLAKLADLVDQTAAVEQAPRKPTIKDNTGSKAFRV